jgi:hypothetical protein
MFRTACSECNGPSSFMHAVVSFVYFQIYEFAAFLGDLCCDFVLPFVDKT